MKNSNQAHTHGRSSEPDRDAAGAEPDRAGPAPASDAATSPAAAAAADVDTDWKDRFLRAKADLANLQRRTGEELQAAVRYANADFARAILEITDDFQRTLQAAPDSGRDELLAGIRLVLDKLLKALKDRHVEPIQALGLPFDPKLHEALMQQPSAGRAPGTVIQEVQTGYRFHDRILRPARVIIAKAPGPGDVQKPASEPDLSTGRREE